ncbi:MAG: hypothetical protein QOE16_1040 [Microbacteriaceae bacterium]|jgi:hypothetical protein|nr:hypothetical protein [Microbacteriaceae bacterium]
MRYLERAIWAGVLSLAGSILAGLLVAAPTLWFLQNILNYGCDTNDAFVCQQLIASVVPGLAAVAFPSIVTLVVGEAIARNRLAAEARRRLARMLALAAPVPAVLAAVVPAFTPAGGPAALLLLELSATIVLAALVIHPWDVPATVTAPGLADAGPNARSREST